MKLIYDYIEQYGKEQLKNEDYSFFYKDSIELDPNNFIYLNLETSQNDSIFDNISDVIWRIKGYDDSDNLPPNSFLRKYVVTEEQKVKMFNDICKEFNDPDSEQYKEYKDKLGLDTLVGKIGPLYHYPRVLYRHTPGNVFNSACPPSRDKYNKIVAELENDENFKKLDNEDDKKKYIKNIIDGYNNTILDQLNQIFFSMQNNFFLSEAYRFVLYMNDPTYIHLPIGKNETKHAVNIFSHLNPFPLLLDTVQFLFINDKVSVKLNFNDFDVGNMFDVLYGIVLLLLASQVSNVPIGKVYINSPLYHVKRKYFEYFKNFNSNQLDSYKISLKVDSEFNDFSDLKEKNLIVEKL